jgi:hypothetical protein
LSGRSAAGGAADSCDLGYRPDPFVLIGEKGPARHPVIGSAAGSATARRPDGIRVDLVFA